METTPLRARILDTIIRKSTLKQKVFDNSFAAFNTLKETLFEMVKDGTFAQIAEKWEIDNVCLADYVK